MASSSRPITSEPLSGTELYTDIVSTHLTQSEIVDTSAGLLRFHSHLVAVTGITSIFIPTVQRYRTANFVLEPAVFQNTLDAVAFVLYDRLFFPIPRIFLIDAQPLRETISLRRQGKAIKISLFQLGQWIEQGHELDMFSFIPVSVDRHKVIFTEHADFNGEQFQNYLCKYLLRLAGSDRSAITIRNKGTYGYDVQYQGKGIEVKGVSSLYRQKSNKGRLSRFTFDKDHFRDDLDAVAFIVYDRNLLRTPKTFFVEPKPVRRFLEEYDNTRHVQISLYQVQHWAASASKIDPIAFVSDHSNSS